MWLFIVDCSPVLGYGHLIRCLNLARLNRKKRPTFLLTHHDKAAIEMLRRSRFDMIADCPLNLTDQPPQLVVFDIVQMGTQVSHWLERFREGNIRTIQITDLGLNPLSCDVTIDGTFPHPEDQVLPSVAFRGPQYAMLHHKSRHFHCKSRHYREHVKRVFISFGGGSSYRNLRKTIDILSRHRYQCFLAPGFQIKKNHKKVLSRLYPSIHWVGQTESLARALFQSDLAIISPGVTAYEAASAGTPALYLSHHARQLQSATLFETRRVGLSLGLLSDIGPTVLLKAIASMNRELRAEMGEKGKEQVDGLGLYRVNKIIHSAVI